VVINEQQWVRQPESRQDLLAAVDRLVGSQTPKKFRCQPASGPAHQGDAVEIGAREWQLLRDVASSLGTRLADDRVILNPEMAARFAAALRNADSSRWPPKAQAALRKVLGVVHLGRGLQVVGVQE
jgi:hypothetical protein